MIGWPASASAVAARSLDRRQPALHRAHVGLEVVELRLDVRRRLPGGAPARACRSCPTASTPSTSRSVHERSRWKKRIDSFGSMRGSRHEVLEGHADEQPQVGEERLRVRRQVGHGRVGRLLARVGQPLAQRVGAGDARVPHDVASACRASVARHPLARARRLGSRRAARARWPARRRGRPAAAPACSGVTLQALGQPRGSSPGARLAASMPVVSADSPAPVPARSSTVTATGATIPCAARRAGRRRRRGTVLPDRARDARARGLPVGLAPPAHQLLPEPRVGGGEQAARPRTPPRRRCPRCRSRD